MAVFPEHLHVDDEDRLLRHAVSEDQNRHLMEGAFGVMMIAALFLVAGVVALAFL